MLSAASPFVSKLLQYGPDVVKSTPRGIVCVHGLIPHPPASIGGPRRVSKAPERHSDPPRALRRVKIDT